MIRTYERPKKEQLYSSCWDGDCRIYTVYDNEEEQNQEKERLEKINAKYEEVMKQYKEAVKNGLCDL